MTRPCSVAGWILPNPLMMNVWVSLLPLSVHVNVKVERRCGFLATAMTVVQRWVRGRCEVWRSEE